MKQAPPKAPGDLSIEDTHRSRLRLQRKEVRSLEPYGTAIRPVTRAGKAHVSKIGEWIKAKRLAEELRQEEQAAHSPAEPARTVVPRQYPLFLSLSAVVAAVRRAVAGRLRARAGGRGRPAP